MKDVVAIDVVGHEDKLDLSILAQAVIDADPCCGTAGRIFLCEEEGIGVGVESFRVAKLHRVLESGAFFVEGVDGIAKVLCELDSQTQGNDVGLNAVFVVGGASVIMVAAAAEKGKSKGGDQQKGRQGQCTRPRAFVHKMSNFSGDVMFRKTAFWRI